MEHEPELNLQNNIKDSTQIVLASTAIRDIISTEYPSIHNALLYNEMGTIKVMQAYGALHGAFGEIEANHEFIGGDRDGIKTWDEWKICISTFLNKINDDYELKIAREALAHIIWTEHYDKLKYWPTVQEKEKQATININVKAHYNLPEANPTHIVIWSAIGSNIVVTDMNNQHHYSTKINGKLKISFVLLNIKKVHKIEELFITLGNETVYKFIDDNGGKEVDKIQFMIENNDNKRNSTNFFTKFKKFFNIN